MRTTRFFTFLTTLVLTLSAYAYDFQSGDLYYKITSNTYPYTVEVTYKAVKYSAENTPYPSFTNAVIPKSVRWSYNNKVYSVTSIGNRAFHDCFHLTSVTIPNSVTSIGTSAFYECDRLTSVTIPESVTTISDSAFYRCSSLTSITIPSSVNFIGNCAFEECAKLTSVNIPAGITSISSYVFKRCSSLTSVTIPEGVTSIGSSAFLYTALDSVTIPESVTSIGGFAFGETNLTSVIIPNSVTSIGMGAFNGCRSLTSITIPGGITRIESYTFRSCSKLTSVIIPSGVTVIGPEAFSGCYSLTSITIPDGVTRIWNQTFKNCTSLTSCTIPSGVTQIDDYAFYACKALQDVVCRSVTPPTLATAFPKNTGMTLKVPCSAVETYKTTTNWKNFTTILGSTFSGFNLALESNNTQYGIAQACPVCDNMIEAIAKPNCHFVRWNDGKTENPRTISLTSDSTFVATFAVDTYHVTATTNQTTLGMVTGSNIYEYNTPATIEAIANEGYGFVQWNDGNTENPRIVTVTSDSAFVATFDVNYTISVTSADAVMGTVVGGGKYVNNTQTTIEAVANEGYSFVQWNDGNTQNPRTFTVTSDSAFVATFELKSFNVTATTTQTAMGQVTGSGIYEYNTQATIEAIPNEGYTFVQWNDLNTENPRTILVTSDATYTATFMTITAIEQVTAETLNLRIENGTILCDGDMRIYDLIGRDVTHQNGLLQGVYMVRVDNLVVKVIVK